MKQTILHYGLRSGLVAALLMTATVSLTKSSFGFEYGAYFGYAGILLSMLFVYFGVRSYRDQVAGGTLSFGKGFQVGLLIALVSCACYVIAWLIVYETLMPDFMDKYIHYTLEKLRSSGTDEAEIHRQMMEMDQFKEMYKNPLVRVAFTFLEPFPVGLGVALVSALMLRKQ